MKPRLTLGQLLVRWVKNLIVGVLLLVLLLGLIGFFLPSKYRVSRSVLIEARPDAVFPLLNRLSRWPEWTAWTTNRDPSMVYDHQGAAAGVGAVQTWASRKSGSGWLKITASEPDKGVRYELIFNRGRVSHGGIALEQTGRGTLVTWHNEGDLGVNPLARYFGLMADKTMGPDFETGLHNLKTKVESSAK